MTPRRDDAELQCPVPSGVTIARHATLTRAALLIQRRALLTRRTVPDFEAAVFAAFRRKTDD